MKALCVLGACALLLAPTPIAAGMIVGIPDSGQYGSPTSLYSVDPQTGSTTPFGSLFSGYIAESVSALNNTIFVSSPVNLYSLNVVTGQYVGYQCLSDLACFSEAYAPFEFAYDSSDQTVYSVADAHNTSTLVLEHMVDLGPSGLGPPGSQSISWVENGPLGVSGIRVIEFIPGLGLYGTDGTSAGYLINETTGQATLLSPLSGVSMPITGLAYDFDTGQLLASAGVYSNPPSMIYNGSGMIYQLDPITGHATLLNTDSADLVGIAFVSTPEPRPAWVVFAGLVLGIALRHRLCTRFE